MSINFSLVLPCYNEESNIMPLYQEFSKFPLKNEKCELIFVNNGSTDNTGKKIDEAVDMNKDNKIIIKKITLDRNKGYGGGIWDGLKISNGKYIGWAHADLQTPLIDFFKLFTIINGKSKIFGKGFRTNNRGFDGIVSRFHERFASIILGYKLKEINAQPKIFSKDLMKYLTDVPVNHTVLDTYVTYVALENKFEVETIKVIFKNRLYGESKWKNRFSTFVSHIFFNFIYLFQLKFLKTKNDSE